MVKATEILERLRALGIQALVRDGKLVTRQPKGTVIPPDLAEEVRAHKAELIRLLAGTPEAPGDRLYRTGQAEPVRAPDPGLVLGDELLIPLGEETQALADRIYRLVQSLGFPELELGPRWRLGPGPKPWAEAIRYRACSGCAALQQLLYAVEEAVAPREEKASPEQVLAWAEQLGYPELAADVWWAASDQIPAGRASWERRVKDMQPAERRYWLARLTALARARGLEPGRPHEAEGPEPAPHGPRPGTGAGAGLPKAIGAARACSEGTAPAQTYSEAFVVFCWECFRAAGKGRVVLEWDPYLGRYRCPGEHEAAAFARVTPNAMPCPRCGTRVELSQQACCPTCGARFIRDHEEDETLLARLRPLDAWG